ncbi:MAG TPA: hypothetical protein VLA21_09290, partial [Candidatus Limnocylindria bacterium]|nr:hypothetical protein [Candidatus Limnocylindria bacterium]
GFEATVMRSGHALDLYGNAARFDGGAPMLFDVILTGRNREGSSLLRYAHADGRAVCGGKDWVFSPASASGVLVEYPGGGRDAALTLTPKGFVSEPCPPATMRAGASAGRLFRRARLAYAAGCFQDGTGLPKVHTPFITEKIR